MIGACRGIGHNEESKRAEAENLNASMSEARAKRDSVSTLTTDYADLGFFHFPI
jgi:hypothetical protein